MVCYKSISTIDYRPSLILFNMQIYTSFELSERVQFCICLPNTIVISSNSRAYSTLIELYSCVTTKYAAKNPTLPSIRKLNAEKRNLCSQYLVRSITSVHNLLGETYRYPKYRTKLLKLSKESFELQYLSRGLLPMCEILPKTDV